MTTPHDGSDIEVAATRRTGLVFVLIIHSLFFAFTFHEADEDLWGRLAMGRLVLGTGQVPVSDPFAYVPTRETWIDHEWLSGVIFQRAYSRLGDVGLLGLRALAGLVAVGLVYWVGSRSAGAVPAAALSLAGTPLLLQGFNGVVRAQVFSFLLFAVCWWLLDTGGRRRIALVPLSALWANLHGGVVTGWALVLVFALMDRAGRRGLLVLLGLCVVASAANPYGVAYWGYLAEALTMPRPHIVEWRAVALVPLLDDLHLKLGAALVGAIVLGSSRPTSAGRLVACGVLVASLLHVRFAPFVALALPAALATDARLVFAKGAAAFPARLRASAAPLAVTVLGLSLALLGGYIGYRSRDFGVSLRVPADRYPVAAVDHLVDEGAEGGLAVYFNWGEYALYRLHPRMGVSIDGRYETVYPPEIVELNWELTFAERGRRPRLLDLHPPAYALFPTGGAAASWLDTDPGWRLVHRDGLASLYGAVDARPPPYR